jgi:4-amino-4-deoxy-L-arabinose transferase-like glycosyltransferase
MRVYDWMLRNEKIILTLSIVIIAILHIIFLFKPVSTDAGAFLTIALGILKGNLPYVNYFDHKPPGVYYLLASFLSLENSIYAAKLGTMLFNMATAITLFFIGKKLWNEQVGILSSIFYLAGLLVYEGCYILTEPFLAFFSSLAILCFVEYYSTKKYSYLFLSGIMIGISMLFKQTGILTLFGIFFFYLLGIIRSKQVNIYIKNDIILSIGFLLPIVLTVFYFYSVNALNDLIYCVFSVNLHSYPTAGVLTFLYCNYLNIFQFPLIWILSISGVVIAVVHHFKAYDNKNQNKEIFISILFVFSAIPIVIRQYPHYYIQILPFASLLASYTIFKLKEPMKSIFESDRLKIVAIFVILVLLAPTLVQISIGTYSLKSYNLNDEMKIADYIKSHTKPDEKIFVTGQPKYYFLSDREPMNKNIYLFPINLNNTYTEESIIQNLKNEKIRYVLVSRVRDFKDKKIDKYIQDNYELKKEFCKRGVITGQHEPITKVYKKKEETS